MTEATLSAVKVFLPTIISFVVGMFIAPAWIDILKQKKMWKKKAKTKTIDGREAVEFQRLHAHTDVGTPRMGGVVIWLSVLVTILAMWILGQIVEVGFLNRLDFLSRNQTWLPTFALLVGATSGLVDDYMDINGKKGHLAGGLSLRKRLLAVTLLGTICGWWFFQRLGVEAISIPFAGDLFLGWLIVPVFMVVMLATYSGGVIDGIDGLSGGVFSSIFTAYGIIAFTQDQINLSAFCFVIVGGILAFLWYNVPPAKFYMTETGTAALTVALTVVAFLTDQVILLLVIAFPLVFTPVSNIIQLVYRKTHGGKKLFRIAPIHHHFEAIGWPSHQVTMRYWIISIIFAFMGTILALISG